MNPEKLQTAIDHLTSYRSLVDNYLYHTHSKESLKKELEEISESIYFLESLKE